MHNLPTHRSEILGGLALLLAALAALLIVNLGGGHAYHHLLEAPLTLGLEPLSLTKSLHHWINDGLMALFFLLIGIEIQREFMHGSFRNPRQALSPLIAAVAGFALPACMFLALTHHNPQLAKGWPIPAATDIAFALALFSLLRNHLTASLRAFLLALAVADDLLAILTIAIFFTSQLALTNALLAIACAIILIIARKSGLRSLLFFLPIGALMWLLTLQSGVHATLAGVVLGLLLPLKNPTKSPSPAHQVEHALQPFVRWAVLPLFAFANTGISLAGITLATFTAPPTLGIIAALVVGKQFGIFGTVWLLEKTTALKRPQGASWPQTYATACICGIGFTMSLFIANLALAPELQPQARLGILTGSLLSTLCAILVLSLQNRPSLIKN